MSAAVFSPSRDMSANYQQGVVLLESLIAILIFSMGILALAGLQATMLKNTSDSKYRADAGYIAQQSLGAMWADPGNLANYVEGEPGTDISALLPNGRRVITVSAGGVVDVKVTWQNPGQPDTHTFRASARIAGG